MLLVRDEQLESKLLQYVAKHPGTSASDIAKNLKIKPFVARLYVRKLLGDGSLLGSLGHERPYEGVKISERGTPEEISEVVRTAPQEPYMSFVVDKEDEFDDKVLLSDKAGNNSLSLGRNHPLLGKVRQGTKLDVYGDHIDVK